MNLAEWLEDTLDGQSSAEERALFRLLFEEKAQELYRLLDPSLHVEVSLLLVSPFEPKADETWERIILCPGDSFDGADLVASLHAIPPTGEYRRISDAFADVERSLQTHLRAGRRDQALYASEIVDGRLYGHIVLLKLDGLTNRAAANSPSITGAPTSLVEAAAKVFLAECCAALGDPYPPRYKDVLGIRLQELLRSSACALLESIGDCADLLYDAMEALSSELYEGASARGSMVLVPEGRLRESMMLLFDDPIEFAPARYKYIRKLLETTRSGELSLVLEIPSDPHEPLIVTGLIHKQRRDPSSFRVSFQSHRTWGLHYGNEHRMIVAAGTPSVPRYKADFIRKASLRFEGIIGSAQVEHLWHVTSEALGQVHGTIVVIAVDAAAEVQRLSCTRVRPTNGPLDLVAVRPVTAIDGALILDPFGDCHAIGAILRRGSVETPTYLLDATHDPARGARYNSTVEYVTFAPVPRLAVIVSEDGAITVV